jgi:hypothetical protein
LSACLLALAARPSRLDARAPHTRVADRADHAHPLHTSVTELTYDAASRAVTVSVRLFADDFGMALRARGATPSLQGSSLDAIARDYFAAAVALVRADGAPIALAWCGIREESGLIWLCARAAGVASFSGLRLRNALMFDRFPDQISIVRAVGSRGVQTLLLTKKSPVGVVK